MATLVTWSGEGGTADTAITTGNSGGDSGTAFNNVTGPFTYSATGKAHGSLGARVQISSATSWRAYHAFSETTQLSARFYLTLDALPSAALALWGAVNTSFAQNMRLQINASNTFFVVNASGSSLATASEACTAGQVYRIEIQTAPGASSSTGTVKCRIYKGDDTSSPIMDYSATNVNAGTTGILRGQLGNNDSASSLDVTFDDIEYRNTMEWIGPYNDLPSPAGVVSLVSVTDPGSWTVEGAETDPVVALSDTDDATYVETEDNPSTSAYVTRLAPLTAAPGYVTGQIQADAGTQTITIALKQGTTTIATTSALVLSTGWSAYTLTLTSTERAAITTAGDGSVSDLDVVWTANTP